MRTSLRPGEGEGEWRADFPGLLDASKTGLGKKPTELPEVKF